LAPSAARESECYLRLAEWAGRVLWVALLALFGCASVPPEPAPVERRGDVDFTGLWEIDYGRSDDPNRALRTALLRLTRPASANSRVDTGGAVNSYSSAALQSVVSLARLAEEITRATVLDIDQSPYELYIDRGEDTFALTCALFEDRVYYDEGALATELCGWDGDRFVFRATLPDGLTINHRLTMAPDGDQLHVASTLSAPGAAAPFTLNRFYRRFERLSTEGDNCRDTLTRGRVCEGGR
jgi:hypothetical protein